MDVTQQVVEWVGGRGAGSGSDWRRGASASTARRRRHRAAAAAQYRHGRSVLRPRLGLKRVFHPTQRAQE